MRIEGAKLKRLILLFVLGASCFIVSQPLLRIPLLNFLQGKTTFLLFYNLYPLLTGILIAFSAALFEEGFRFIYKTLFLRRVKLGILEPILFGLGHGLAEALIVLLPALGLVAFQNLYLAIFERVLAIVLHIGLSLIIWNGFQLDKKYKYLGLAILVHGGVNSLIPIFAGSENSILLIEGALLIIAIFILIYIYRSKKYYKLKEE